MCNIGFGYFWSCKQEKDSAFELGREGGAYISIIWLKSLYLVLHIHFIHVCKYCDLKVSLVQLKVSRKSRPFK